MAKDFLILLIIITILCGLIFGWLRLSFFDTSYAEFLGEALQLHLASPVYQPASSAFFGSLIVYGRILLLIIILAHLPMGFIGSFFLLFLRAMAVGFSAGVFMMAFEGRGVGLLFMLVVLQNFIMFPIYCGLLSQGIRRRRMTIKALLVGIAAVLVVSAYEAFMLPLFIPFFL